ncbi:MAG: class I SAM-dependent methyltransferase, partial [Alphaproteobacteria bacterium]|nr:class I SAM-dependent methyltransferase [Alphaproteobacteria bacterium]
MHPERGGRKRPPSVRHEGQHALSPAMSHDDLARFDFVMTSYFHVAQDIYPGAKRAYQTRVEPAFVKQHGHTPATRAEVRKAMYADPYWQMWSALKRGNQELSYAARSHVLAHAFDKLEARAAQTGKRGAATLRLNPALEVPRYITAVDLHCMPGGYNADDGAGLYAGAMYDTASLYLATGGEFGKWNDAAGWSMVNWIVTKFADVKPKRILDLGCTVGHSTLPLAQHFPKAEVHAIDACAPLLRFAKARADSLGVGVQFSQQNAEATDFPDNYFDVVTSAMFLHEVPQKSMQHVVKEIHRVLKPGGVMLHAEQPQYHGQPADEQFLREWDTRFNNEPFRCAFRDMD